MKTAKWEVSTGALASFMASRPQAAFKCHLYTFDLLGSINSGTPLLYATADVDVTVPYAGGTKTYSSKEVFFDTESQRAVGHQKVGLDVDTWQVPVTPAQPNGAYAGATIGGLSFLTAVSRGLLAGATVTIDEAIWDIRTQGLPFGNPITPNIGVYTKFCGTVAEIDVGRSQCVISVNDLRSQLSLLIPRNVLSPRCRWVLFGTGCTLNAADYAVSGTAISASDNILSATVATPSGSGTYALGRIVMTSGLNKGLARQVRSWTAGSPASLVLIAPFPSPISSGDTFTAYPGCDHTPGSCSRFGNYPTNFGGIPFVPAPETAV